MPNVTVVRDKDKVQLIWETALPLELTVDQADRLSTALNVCTLEGITRFVKEVPLE